MTQIGQITLATEIRSVRHYYHVRDYNRHIFPSYIQEYGVIGKLYVCLHAIKTLGRDLPLYLAAISILKSTHSMSRPYCIKVAITSIRKTPQATRIAVNGFSFNLGATFHIKFLAAVISNTYFIASDQKYTTCIWLRVSQNPEMMELSLSMYSSNALCIAV